MTPNKRCLLWDWTNTDGPGHKGVPWAMDAVDFKGPMSSVCNWNTWVPPELKGRAPFRPMVHLEAQLSGGDWQNIENTREPIILFFNEPERAGITPQHAADVWRTKMLPLRQHKGKKLVSPSCASDPKGQEWINDFMHLVADHPPDFLGLHYYGTDAKGAIEYIESMHKKHAQQQVMITEIASISRSYHDIVQFTAVLANWMDGTPWIFEYGFFGCMRTLADGFVSPEAQLMKPDGHFTPLMEKLVHEVPMKV
ncbi:MAG: hypothetical protein LQ338_005249 [Usnochroma carphineum]|nr:MAG: hypothetical protein LQ338_005249 [Usnochroma carphineum]